MNADESGQHPNPVTRRAVLGALIGAAAAPLAAQATNAGKSSAETPSGLRPFRIAVPQADIDRILRRLRDTRWPDRIEATGWEYGANWNYMKELADYWTTRFDWRKAEAGLNRYPQFLARVGDYDIHFHHVRGRGPRPMPLVLTHGWPGSIVEFQQAIGPLSDPAAFGGNAEDAFDVVVPSLPGFGYSSKPKGKPIGPVTIAHLWHTLMADVLGYQRFGAQGGDWGSAVTIQLGSLFPESLVGIHLNSGRARPVPDSEQSPEERAAIRASGQFLATGVDYANEQRNKPQTVAFVLTDHPLGTAAWIVEKMKDWSDSGDHIEKAFTKDQILTNVMWYLVTDTPGTSVWIYRGAVDEPGRRPLAGPAQPIKVPTAFAAFPKEPFGVPPEAALARDFNIVRYTAMPRGGHFACFEQPQLLVDDVRAFFRMFRA
jgi:pimeloyl-ACP methyl ester carboxylesterase